MRINQLTYLVPSLDELLLRVVEETSYIGTTEGDADQVLCQTHGIADGQVTPVSSVIPSPDGNKALGTSEMGSSQQEGSLCTAVPGDETLIGRPCLERKNVYGYIVLKTVLYFIMMMYAGALTCKNPYMLCISLCSTSP